MCTCQCGKVVKYYQVVILFLFVNGFFLVFFADSASRGSKTEIMIFFFFVVNLQRWKQQFAVSYKVFGWIRIAKNMFLRTFFPLFVLSLVFFLSSVFTLYVKQALMRFIKCPNS